MKKTHFEHQNFFKAACYFEGSLIFVSVILGWLTGIDPFSAFYFSETALSIGVFATLPLLIIFVAMQHLSYPAIQDIRQLLQQTLGPPLSSRHWSDILVLSCIAGFSEELLFRGVLQPWLESVWNADMGLIASSVIFALVHAITPLYLVLAFLVSIYLGLFLDYGGERSLLTPVVIHALYDFVAFIIILTNFRKRVTPS